MSVMPTFVLLFPLVADQDGICLVEPEPWLHGPVQEGVGVHKTVEAVLFGHGVADPEPLIVHSTSWHELASPRDGGGARYQQVDAYLAILDLTDDYPVVESRWPAAIPVDLDAIAAVGRPAEHGPTLPPREVLQAHALAHGLRHLSLELGPLGDSELRDALKDTPWPRHLEDLQPVMAAMYRHDLAEALTG
jgi:hypothetical protein